MVARSVDHARDDTDRRVLPLFRARSKIGFGLWRIMITDERQLTASP
jgi:hypothetical protein